METELKPCPFCGKPGELTIDDCKHGDRFNLGCSDPVCIAWHLWDFVKVEFIDDAPDRWNRRAEPVAATPPAAVPAEKPGLNPENLSAEDRIERTARDMLGCAATWESGARLLGNVTAGEIRILCEWVLGKAV